MLLLALGTWLIRFSFLGIIGDRPLPPYVKQMLGYTSVAVLPGIATPMVLNGVEGAVEPLRLVAAVALVLVGIWTQNMMKALGIGLRMVFKIIQCFWISECFAIFDLAPQE